MFKTAAFALAAASLVMAQDVTVNSATLTQCAQSTLPFTPNGSGPYYVAIVPASNPCGSDAYAEFYDVSSQSVDYYAKIPSGTQVQMYVADNNSGQEWWSAIMTVGDGDSACLGSDAAVSSSSSSSAPTSSSTPTTYIPPSNTAGSTYTPSSNSNSNSNTGNVANNNDTPANAADDTTSGSSTITASTTLLVGAFAAAIALF